MNKIIFFITFILATSYLLAIDWSQYGYMPCTTEGPEWSVPTDDTYSYLGGTNDPCNGCTFRIHYSVRWNAGHYELLVLGIENISTSPCNASECNLWNLIWGFWSWNILSNKATFEQGFLDQIHNGAKRGSPLTTTIYSTAKCLNNGTECEPEIIRCCKYVYQFQFIYNSKTYYWEANQTGHMEEVTPPCPSNCQLLCNQTRPYECNCVSPEGLAMIQFIQKPNNPCCYDLKIDNNKNCSLRVSNIKFMISEVYRYSEKPLDENGFQNNWNLTLQPNWTKSIPFYNNQLRNFNLNRVNPALIPPVTTADIAEFCLPEDGKIYKITFFLETQYSECKSVDFYVRCMPAQSNCCNNINVSYSIDNSQPDRCCYFLIFTNTNSNCIPSFYNVYDKKGTNLADWDMIGKEEPYKENVPLGPFCVNGTGNHEIVVDLFFYNGQNYTVCAKNISTVVCPTSECCSKISIVPNTPTTGPNGECCYTFNITTSDPNCHASLTITDPLTPQNGISLIDAFGTSVPATPICIAAFSGNHNLLFDFTLANNEHCYKNVTISCPDNCCANFSATIGNIATKFDHSDICCYPITYSVGNSVPCQASKIVVTGPGSEKIWEKSLQGSNTGTFEDVFCIKKELMIGSQSYDLTIQFLASNGSLICSYPSTIIPCTGTVEPCSPPLQQGETGDWSEEKELNGVKFQCPQNSGKYCEVECRYRVRHVKNGITSVHRDIQVTQYTLKDNSCICTDAMVNSLLKDIIQRNLGEFEISDINWPIDEERYFNNFRITTVDCWEAAPLPPLNPAPTPIFTKKCNDAVCCYAFYQIKIKKVSYGGGKIAYFVMGIQKLSESQIQINTCIPPCEPLNCEKWRPNGNGHAKLPINLEGKDNNNCKIFITNNINDEFPSIKLDCDINGLTSIEIFDIKGNSIFGNVVVKNTKLIELIVNKKLISGIYLIKVTIDSKQVLFDKFNFIK